MSSAERQEHQHLAQADQHLADGERNVTEQTALVERLRATGDDALAAAEAILDTFQKVLEQHRAHRAAILARLDELGAGSREPGRGRPARTG